MPGPLDAHLWHLYIFTLTCVCVCCICVYAMYVCVLFVCVCMYVYCLCVCYVCMCIVCVCCICMYVCSVCTWMRDVCAHTCILACLCSHVEVRRQFDLFSPTMWVPGIKLRHFYPLSHLTGPLASFAGLEKWVYSMLTPHPDPRLCVHEGLLDTEGAVWIFFSMQGQERRALHAHTSTLTLRDDPSPP